jgi:signal transduction histidine kinase
VSELASEPISTVRIKWSSWPLSRIIGGAVLIATLFSVAAVVGGALALTHLDDQRQRVETVIDPAELAAQQLNTALVNQETGVRGYALSGQTTFLTPYNQGYATEKALITQLHALLPQLPPAATTDFNQATTQARNWRTRYAQPTIKQIQAAGKPVVSPDILAGKSQFDALRTRLTSFEVVVSGNRQQALHALNDAGDELDAVLLIIAIGLVVVVVVLGFLLRATAIRPVNVLAAEARRVADGDFGHEVAQTGPREIRGLGADVNSMRLRILQELSAIQEASDTLAEHAEELQRSNAELEQFAYVASHDLQEPLRKVASFCQLLQRRYGGQLDERADQYIEFAVDGAKRMQVLINDLLAFSRVGRHGTELTLMPADAALASARANLATQIEQSGAVIEAPPLPAVRAQLTLLSAVFQNLLGNALKFRGEGPPHVAITVERDGEFWLFSVADNGIGIDAQYADRVFLIFQRLHDKAAYPGTGIGLAMCRKIIEYFGGRIWLDTEVMDGTRFRFTLPVQSQELQETKGTDGLPD